MEAEKEFFLSRLRKAFNGEKIICRVIAAWCTFAAINLFSKGTFTELSFAQDTSILKISLCTAGAFIIFTGISVLLTKFHTDSWFLLASSTFCVVCWLLSYNAEYVNTILFCLAVIIVYSLFVLYFLWRNDDWLKKWQPKKKATFIIAITCGVLMGLIISILTCTRYTVFSSPNFDFGIFCNMFHYMRETGLPFVTCERDMLLSHFAVHISPIYYVLLPFYYIFPSPLTLQIGQALILASGIVPIWLLCGKFNVSGKITALISVIYAFYPAITCGTFYDIHENCFLLPLLLWMFFFFEKEKYIPMYVFAVAVLMVKEDAAVYVLIFAIYIIISRKKYFQGISLAAFAVAYFLLAIYLLKTFGTGAMTNRFGNLIFNREDGLLGAVKTALFNPGYLLTQMLVDKEEMSKKLIYFLQMILPLGLIPFCSKKPSRWLLLTPVLINLLTSYGYQYEINFQYHFGITAFLFYAAIQNIPELHAPTRKTLVSIGAVASCCIYLVVVFPKLSGYVKQMKNIDTFVRMEEILDTIPTEASVCASTMLIPHIADRDIIYEVHYHEGVPDIEYVVLDMRPGYKTKNQGFIDEYIKQGYTLYAEYENMITILKQP